MEWLNFSCHWESFIQREDDIWTDQYGIRSMELAVCNMMLQEFFKILIFYMFQDVGMKIFKFFTIFWIMAMLSYSGGYISAINPLLLKKKSEYFQFSNLKPLWHCLVLLQSGDFCDQLLRWMPFYALSFLWCPWFISQCLYDFTFGFYVEAEQVMWLSRGISMIIFFKLSRWK